MMVSDKGVLSGRSFCQSKSSVTILPQGFWPYSAASPHFLGQECATIRVNEDCFIIINQSFAGRIRRAVNAIAVAEILLMGRQQNMPHVTGPVFDRDQAQIHGGLGRSGIFWPVIDNQGDAGGMAAEDGKVYTFLQSADSSGQGIASFSYI